MAILAAVRLRITTPAQLARNRRYAYLILAVIAMVLPGTDPVTMLVELVPLLLLYEFSIVLARLFGETRDRRSVALGETSGR
jgi:sec-independent protein translocase protein TatC